MAQYAVLIYEDEKGYEQGGQEASNRPVSAASRCARSCPSTENRRCTAGPGNEPRRTRQRPSSSVPSKTPGSSWYSSRPTPFGSRM